jgi:ABC-2 type transport system permease protein
MTTTSGHIRRTPAVGLSKLRWAAADGWTVTRRDLIHWTRQPFAIAVGLLFPVMLVLVFGYLFGGGMTIPGGGSYLDFLLPGMFAMTMAFGVEATFTAVSTDASRGVTDRFRSMPMAASAVVVGRSAADMINSVLGLAVMLACGLAVGWQWHNGPAAAAAAVALLLWLRFALLWLGIFLGLLIKSPEAVMMIQILIWPIGFLSSAFASPADMPGWLGTIAAWNPLSSTAAATRQLFGNPGWGGDTWIAEHAILMAAVWPLIIVAVFFPLSVRAYRRLNR